MNKLPYRKRSIITGLFIILFGCILGQAQERTSPTTVFLVRHAEKDTMKTDPPLTAKGRDRAATLSRLVQDAGITAVYVTQYTRTQQTVQPLCDSLHIQYTVMEVNRDSLQHDANVLVDEVLAHHRGETVFIAGHSNTLPLIIRAFGIRDEITIADQEYDNLFIVTKARTGEASLVRLRFGK